MSFDLQLTNNDLSINSNGKIKTVTDTPKLRQDILKFILTPLGSVKLHPWYGCNIEDDIIGKILHSTFVVAQIKSNITQSLERLKALQRSQSAIQKVSLAEMIEVVAAVDAERDLDDGRRINVVVSVLSKRLTRVDELFTLIS